MVGHERAVDEGEGEVSSGVPCAAPTRWRSSQGTYKEPNPMCPCWHPNQQSMFHLPIIHTLLFVSLVCCGGPPVTSSGGVPVVFRQKVFLSASIFRSTTRNTPNVTVIAGCR